MTALDVDPALRAPERRRPAVAVAETAQVLHVDLLSAYHRAHLRLLVVEDVERRHRDTPLDDLAALAASGALHLAPLSRNDVIT